MKNIQRLFLQLTLVTTLVATFAPSASAGDSFTVSKSNATISNPPPPPPPPPPPRVRRPTAVIAVRG